MINFINSLMIFISLYFYVTYFCENVECHQLWWLGGVIKTRPKGHQSGSSLVWGGASD